MVFLAARRSVPGWVRDPLWARARQVPALDIDFTRGSIVDRIGGIAPTFTRAGSVKLAWDGSQFVSYAADVPAFQRAADGVMEYLHEPAETNLCTAQNLAPGNGWQTISNGTITEEAGEFGAANVYLLTEDAATGFRNTGRAEAAAYASGTTYAFSLFCAPVVGAPQRFPIFILNSGAFGGVRSIGFDLLTGATSSNDAGLTGYVESYGSGLYRVVCTMTATSTSTTQIQLRTGASISQGTGSHVGADAPVMKYFWPQFAEGSRVGSPILTDGSTVLRAADVMTVTGTPAANLIAQLGGSLWMYADIGSMSGSSLAALLSIDNGAVGERLQLRRDGVNTRANAITVTGNVSQGSPFTASGSWPGGAGRKLSAAFGTNDIRLHLSGGLSGNPDTSATMATGFNQVTIGTGLGVAAPAVIQFRRLAIFSGTPSDVTLANVVA